MKGSNFLIGVLLVSCAMSAHSTPQIPDTLIHGGKQYPIYNDVLHEYFVKFPERNPKRDDYMCSGAWDGYHATFEIRKGKLTLKDITDEPCEFSKKPRSALKKVVPGGAPLLIDWYTGVLLSMSGDNQEDPDSLERLDAFSRYSLFEIDHGNLRREKHFSNKEYKSYRDQHFEIYKKTDEYKEGLKKRTSNGSTAESDANADMKFWIFWSARKLLID